MNFVPVEYVSPTIIRERFNNGPYALAIDRGEFRAVILAQNHLRNPAAVGRLPCTWSEVVRYLDTDGNIAVEVHRFVRQGLRLGRPDPKRLRDGAVLLVARRD
jgi:hypothetical protein